MSKKILAISSSLRNNSNTDILADEFIRGALSSGHEVEKISLRDKIINFCLGCDICQNTKRCVFQDDASEIVKKIHEADVIVFAAPVYFGGVSGQMQTLLDRTYPLFPWKLNLEQTHRFQDVYLLTASSGESNEFSDKVIIKIEDWIKHFSGVWVKCQKFAKLAGVIRGLGVHEAGEIRKHPDKMNEAYEMGKDVGVVKNCIDATPHLKIT
ncbi:MAG: putative NAD(P)H-dependent FMN-containing oxidoreductase YwqN [Candidatus Anoxychlamydiales bacterium]|nr:putative NAD(P)H-dependent FMN-containing oxidoreductase YwqN [Candidatus Anoxychlamydiales bacterium]